MNSVARICSPHAFVALCVLVIATVALAPAARAGVPPQCARHDAAGHFVTASEEMPCPSLPNSILSEGEADEAVFWRMSKSQESATGGALFTSAIRMTHRVWTDTGYSVRPMAAYGFSWVDQSVRLQV